MKITFIVAYDKKFGMGIDNQLPWKLSEDLKNFKSITLNKPVIMGRKTFESIGRVLPNRENIILSRKNDYHPKGTQVYSNIFDIFKDYKNENEIIIIGGGEIFRKYFHLATNIVVTIVNTQSTCDIYFPKWDTSAWKLQSTVSYNMNEVNEFDFQIQRWKKKEFK